jgi:hypothetical protein
MMDTKKLFLTAIAAAALTAPAGAVTLGGGENEGGVPAGASLSPLQEAKCNLARKGGARAEKIWPGSTKSETAQADRIKKECGKPLPPIKK